MFFRIILYAAIVFGVGQFLVFEAELGTFGRHYFQDSSLAWMYGWQDSLTEWLQVLLLLAAIVAFLWVGRKNPNRQPLGVVLAGLVLIVLIRECDGGLDRYIFDGAWQALVGSVAAALMILIYFKKNILFPAVHGFIDRASFGVLLAGLLTAVIFAQLFSQEAFWTALVPVPLDPDQVWYVDRMVEEGTESLGYALWLIAALEYRWA